MENKNPLSMAQRASVEAGNFEALSSPYRPRLQANAEMRNRLRWLRMMEAQDG
jgi:hypothetical protein